jgi:murein DD-endopeptidase MepM/ murein hydrolase activator NlpD
VLGRFGRVWLLSVLVVGWISPGLWAETTWWVPPVDAPVVDPFRPPATRFGAGNRGLEYGTFGGEPVWAVADGRVTFAGTVARHRFVVVTHVDGLRSTYGFLRSASVVRGQFVSQGQRVGRSGPGFHLTARLGDEYVDPVLLFAGAEVVIRLIENAAPIGFGRRMALVENRK